VTELTEDKTGSVQMT